MTKKLFAVLVIIGMIVLLTTCVATCMNTDHTSGWIKGESTEVNSYAQLNDAYAECTELSDKLANSTNEEYNKYWRVWTDRFYRVKDAITEYKEGGD